MEDDFEGHPVAARLGTDALHQILQVRRGDRPLRTAPGETAEIADRRRTVGQGPPQPFGAFRVAGAAHHGPATVEYDISDLLLKQGVTDLSGLTLSWVRVDGDNPPAGKTISVDEMRIELASASQIITPQGPTGPKGWYR